MISRTLLLKLANSKRAERFVRGSRAAMAVAQRFVAGETIESAVEAVKVLNIEGVSVSLDLLGESVTTVDGVEGVVERYTDIFDAIHRNRLDANVSVKLTSLGLDLDEEICRRNLIFLLKAAGPDLFVRIDMEGSAYTQRTLDLFYNVWCADQPMRNVGIVLQAYLKRTEADLECAINHRVRVRICKGAYQEAADIAFEDKHDVDACYVRCMERLLSAGYYPGIATHDPKMIAAARAYVERKGINRKSFEFQMLYGIRRDLQQSLPNEGYRMRVYTPFGTRWYPYFMRRLAERPANLWFVLKNAFRR